MMRWTSVIFFAIAVTLLTPALLACASSTTAESSTTVTTAKTLTDFSSLAPPDSPNNWLVAPADFAGAARPDETAPVFDVPADGLADAWRAVIESQPRARILATSEDGLRIEADQKSAVFGFTDRISVEVVPLDPGRSTFAAYSTSLVGYWDIGVNRSRLRTWIADLRQRVAAGAGAS